MAMCMVTLVTLVIAPVVAQPLLPGEPDRTVAEWTFAEDTEGWGPTNNLTDFVVEDGVLHTRATGVDAHMTIGGLDLDCAQVTHLFFRVSSDQPGACQVYFATTDGPDPAENDVPVVFCPGDGVFHDLEVSLAGRRGFTGRLTMLRIDPVNGGGESATLALDEIRLAQKAPRLQVKRFAPDRAWVKPRERVSVSLVISDDTGADLTQIVAEPSGWAGPVSLAAGEHPGEFAAMWEGLRATGRGVMPLHADLTIAGRRIAHLQCQMLVGESDDIEDAVVDRCTGDDATELAVVSDAGGAIGLLYALADDGKRRVAGLCSPMATVVYQRQGVLYHVVPQLGLQSGSPNTRLHAPLPDTAHAVVVDIAEPVDRPVVRVDASIISRPDGPITPGPIEVLRLSGPTLLAGEGAFRADKAAALFPGIEYLGPNDRSSDTGPVGEALGYRPAPPPYQITVPLMAVEAEGALVGMMWDPLLPVEGKPAMPIAEFASPNFLDGQANHLMSVYVPSGADLGPPNARARTRPLVVGPGRKLGTAAELFAIVDASIIDAVPLWYVTHTASGAPEPPRAAKPMEDFLTDLIQGWAETCFDRETGGFINHWRIGQEPGPSPSVRASILAHYLDTGDDRWIRTCGIAPETQFIDLLGALPAVSPGGAPPEVIHSQRADGTWAYECPPDMVERVEQWTDGDRHDLGEPGSSCLGLCVSPAIALLSHAIATGNGDSARAGLRALEAMEQFVVPAGAQTWEAHKDVPDIYAAALAISAFRMGYALTGEERYLDRARYWAYTGLPFLYSYQVPGTGPDAVCNVPADPKIEGGGDFAGARPARDVFRDPDRHPTPYGSIPVFGTSFYRVSWFGNLVQWCGLVWAHAVYGLLDDIEDPVLRAAADGVTISGCNQTFDTSPVVGLLPDTWHLGSNVIHPAFIGPGRVEPALRALLRKPTWTDIGTHALRDGGRQVRLMSRAVLDGARLRRDRLSFTAEYPPGQVWDALIIGVAEPASITVAGNELPRVDATTTDQPGWAYDAATRSVRMLCRPSSERVRVRVEW